MTNATNNTNTTITLGKTSFVIESIDDSTCEYIDITAHLVGPRGGHKSLVCFSETCVRVISYGRDRCPSSWKDIRGEEATRIVAALQAA